MTKDQKDFLESRRRHVHRMLLSDTPVITKSQALQLFEIIDQQQKVLNLFEGIKIYSSFQIGNRTMVAAPEIVSALVKAGLATMIIPRKEDSEET